jgi:hypothetical protein
MSDDDCRWFCTRFAAAATALLADPTVTLRDLSLLPLALHNPDLANIFRLTPFHHLDHLLPLMGIECDEQGRVRLESIKTRNQQARLFISRTLSQTVEISPEELFAMSRPLAGFLGLAILATRGVITPAMTACKQRWITAGKLFEEAFLPLDARVLSRLSSAWMLCSYLAGEGKLELKRHLNVLTQRCLATEKLVPCPRPRTPLRDRPTLLVVIDMMTAGHAMYRCHVNDLQQLAERFHLVMLGQGSVVDETVRKLFREQLIFDFARGETVRDAYKAVAALQPDMLYMPSVGMRFWTILFANVRVAPIQVAGMGHPDSTQAPCVDYAINYESFCGKPSCYSETLIQVRDDGFRYEFPASTQIYPLVPSPDGVLRVAIPAWAPKLSDRFMALCRRLQDRAGRPIEFQFFPNLLGFQQRALELDLQSWLARTVVHPRVGYNDYSARLARCQLHLSTFPFGGTNSTYDSLRLGIPAVTLEGDEPYTRLDAFPMRQAGLPDWLVARSEADYEEVALRLICNDAEREALSQAMKRRDLDGVLKREQAQARPRDFVETFWWLYRNHERIQTDGRKTWTPTERPEWT